MIKLGPRQKGSSADAVCLFFLIRVVFAQAEAWHNVAQAGWRVLSMNMDNLFHQGDSVSPSMVIRVNDADKLAIRQRLRVYAPGPRIARGLKKVSAVGFREILQRNAGVHEAQAYLGR
jgi:hypothetical protein